METIGSKRRSALMSTGHKPFDKNKTRDHQANMKPKIRTILRITTLLLVFGSTRTGYCQTTIVTVPERFSVIDVIPNSQSAETDANPKPSLGVATGNMYGDMAVQAMDLSYLGGIFNFWVGNGDQTYVSSGNAWTVAATLSSSGANGCDLDWGSEGTLYSVFVNSPNGDQTFDLYVLHAPGFSGTFQSCYGLNLPGVEEAQQPPLAGPWVKVVSMNNASQQGDHIYVGFNNMGGGTGYSVTGNAASVAFSLDGGVAWNAPAGSANTQPPVVIENENPAYGDSPAVRLAPAADGKTVYALFQRYTSAAPDVVGGTDYKGDVVLVKDSGSGLDSFADLNTKVASDIVLPWDTALLYHSLFSACDVAINPYQPGTVYVAYTELVPFFTKGFQGSFAGVPTPVIRLQRSVDGGSTFNLVYSITNASMPALAVATDGSFGMLYEAESGLNTEVHFFKALGGSFANTNDKILALFPADPDYYFTAGLAENFTLKSVNYNFYGAFSAPNNPIPSHFPSDAFYQRNALVAGGLELNNFSLSSLTSSAQLVDNSGANPVAPSIDPFVFFDIAPAMAHLPIVEIVLPFFYNPSDPFFDPNDPYSETTHLSWPVLPQNETQFQLQTSPVLGPSANWTPVANGLIIQTNGQFEAPLDLSQQQQYFRLNQNLAGAQFLLFANADGNGSLIPGGVLTNRAGQSQTFLATPTNNYGVANWYLDGTIVQSNLSTLTVSNIISEHTLLVTFAPSNDLAVGLLGLPAKLGPALVTNLFQYKVDIANTGLSPLTDVTMTNILDPSVSFVSAGSTQGSVTNFGNLVTAGFGTLGQGADVTVIILVTPNLETTITDTVSVACSQFEPNLANNSATNVTTIITPVTITNQPKSQFVSNGAIVSFNVGAAGTSPVAYQWFFNGVAITSATNATLTMSDVTALDAGSYTVSVFQRFGLLTVSRADSQAAVLTIGSGSAPVVVTLRAAILINNSVMLNATVNPEGSATVAWFSWYTTNFTDVTPMQAVGSGTLPVSFSQTLGVAPPPLIPGNTYFFNIAASNSAGVSYGSFLSFTNPP